MLGKGPTVRETGCNSGDISPIQLGLCVSKLCCLHAAMLELWKRIPGPALSVWTPGSLVFWGVISGQKSQGIDFALSLFFLHFIQVIQEQAFGGSLILASWWCRCAEK